MEDRRVDRNPTEPRRILFLYSDTGGGHRSAAEAIIEALDLEFPGRIQASMVDILKDYSPPPINLAPRIYPVLSRMPRLWGLGYRISDGKRRVKNFYDAIWPYVRRSLNRLLDDHPSDLIVSVHQLINVPVSRLANVRGVPFATVVTDMVTTHTAWYAPLAGMVVVPTEEAYLRGLRCGLAPNQMRVVGMPVAERFNRPLDSRGAIRKRLGWPLDLPVALLVGGGEGMGPLEETAAAIDALDLPFGLAVICGRNEALLARLNARAWKHPAALYGFVREMPAMMHAADILVSKAGPGTISEGFIAGLPLVLYAKIPGQEDGNVTYVEETGAGVWAPAPDLAAETVREWVQHPDQRATVAGISRSLARPHASRQIARILAARAGV